MWFDSPLLLACAQILALAIPGAILAWALRLSGAPGGRHGAAILAGILAGVLLGPAVLGRMAPETHDIFKEIVVDGAYVGRGMPAFGDVLSTEDARAIHMYVVQQSKVIREAAVGGAASEPGAGR